MQKFAKYCHWWLSPVGSWCVKTNAAVEPVRLTSEKSHWPLNKANDPLFSQEHWADNISKINGCHLLELAWQTGGLVLTHRAGQALRASVPCQFVLAACYPRDSLPPATKRQTQIPALCYWAWENYPCPQGMQFYSRVNKKPQKFIFEY